MAPDNFINVPVTPGNADRWIVRKSIRDFMASKLPHLRGELLDVGCGKMPYKDFVLRNSAVSRYTGLDIDSALVYEHGLRPDATWDGTTMPFKDSSFDCALLTEVLEHAPDSQALLREIKRVLKPEAMLCFTTPFVWPYHETPHDAQRWTSFGLFRQLQAAGFHNIEIDLIGNWHSSLAQFLGLWTARAPMSRFVRAAVRYPVFALQRLLMQYDGASEPNENAMPRMVGGTARA
jgi:SAM-dependent methyltransferase